MTRDPLLTELPYAYVDGSPLNAVDSSGHGPEILLLVLACPECAAVGVAGLLALWLILNLQYNHQLQECLTQTSNQIQQAVQQVRWPDLPRVAPGTTPVPGKRYYEPRKNADNPQQAWDKEKKGYKDAPGNVWGPHKGPRPHGGPHWDVQHPDGTHTNVAPDGTVIGPDNFPNVPRPK